MSLDCPFVRRLLSRYLDAELSDRRSAAVERHLSQCRSCQRELDAFVAASRFVATGREVDTPDDAWPRLESRLSEHGISGFGDPSAHRMAVGRVVEAHLWSRRLAVAAILVLAVGATLVIPRLRAVFAPGEALAHEISVPSFLAGYTEHRLDLEAEFAHLYRVREIDIEQARQLCPAGKGPAIELPAGYRLTRVMTLSTDTCTGLVLEYHRGDRCLAVVQAPGGHPIAWGSIVHDDRRIGPNHFEVHEDPMRGKVLVHEGRALSLMVVGTCDTQVLGEVATFLTARAETGLAVSGRMSLH
jgi:hypothetical protein